MQIPFFFLVKIKFTPIMKNTDFILPNLVYKSAIGLMLLFVLSMATLMGQTHIRVITTCDVHGNYFPDGFPGPVPIEGSLAHIKAFADEQRKIEGQEVILLDNGDLLQGKPAGYYFNFVAERPVHFVAEAMNMAGFDAATVGNHDIETGPQVYDRLVKEFDFPYLAANALHIRTGKPYFEPYTVIEREGVRIAILGLVTPTVPDWLPRKLWKNMEFVSMYSSATYWMEHIQEKENPDAVIGLFHSGLGPDIEYSEKDLRLEHASLYVAKYVPGFDVIFTGHDHRQRNRVVQNTLNQDVLILAGESFGNSAAVADLVFSPKQDGSHELANMSGSIVSMTDYEPCDEFMNTFSQDIAMAKAYVKKPVGDLQKTLLSREGYFGNSAFTDFVHQMQMEIGGTDISIAAPLSFDAVLEAGTITMGDMFQLYPFENYLYVMELTGKEIHKHLEYSYGLWLNTMSNPDDHLLLLRRDEYGDVQLNDEGRARLRHAFYNFDSAAGVDYVVDASKPEGERITITGLSNDGKFSFEDTYKVAINSYRGSGGGGHLTRGAGIAHERLENRINYVSEMDLRSHIANKISDEEKIAPKPFSNWKIIPEDWVERASLKDYYLLFGSDD